MSGVYQIPPGRDLPSGRLTQRREHLLAEIVRERESDRAPAPMRLPWPRRRKVVALVAVTLLLVATACAFGVRALILDRGFVGLPPEGATPSTPESGELVESWSEEFHNEWGQMVGWSRYWLYTDGRLIMTHQGDVPQGANPLFSGYLEQRLTPEGVEFMRSAPAHGWSETILEARLADLPASAWADRKVRAYVPARYAVCYWPPGGEPSGNLSQLPAKARELLSARLFEPGPEHSDDDTTCSNVTTAEARALAEMLDDAGFKPGRTSNYHLTYSFDVPGAGWGGVFFEPLLPHGEWISSPNG